MLTARDSNPTHKKYLANVDKLYLEQHNIHIHNRNKEYTLHYIFSLIFVLFVYSKLPNGFSKSFHVFSITTIKKNRTTE